jgi:uncharacterized protein (DUF2235 family)
MRLRAAAPAARKRIVICADGTWNAPTTKDGVDASTNVWRLFEIVHDRATDGTPQLKYYHAGVGTTGSKLRRVIDGASGRGVSANMQDCYRFLVRHYRPGDAVYLFGFSRGAYTARALAGLVRNCGIVDPDKVAALEPARTLDDVLQEAFRLYRDRQPATSPVASRAVQFRARHAHPDFHIACIGVWDTVGALGIPVTPTLSGLIRYVNERFAGFHDVTLSSYVDCAFHALALDEQRGAFAPTLWVQQPHARAAGQVLEQVWFAGAHADVGGGYPAPARGLANVTLRWMVNRVSEHCGLELDLRPLLKREAVRGDCVVHDSTGALYRLANRTGLMEPFTRTVDGGLSDDGLRDAERVVTERLHPSLETLAGPGSAYRPANLADFRARLGRQRPVGGWPPPALDRRRAPQAGDLDTIALERVDGEGRWLARIALTRDGTITVDGRAGHDAAPRSGRLDPAVFAEVAELVARSPFFQLGDEYAPPGNRRGGSALAVGSGRRSKRVVSYDRFGPAWLEDVERAVDAAHDRAR